MTGMLQWSSGWLMVLAFALMVGCGEKEAAKAEQAEGPPVSGTALGEKAIPRLVDLGRTFCIPCKMMAPILKGLKEEYAGRLQVEFIDIGENPAAAKKYGVRLIPTQIFFDASGKELFRHEGFMSKEDILATWKKHGVDLTAEHAQQKIE